MVSWMLGLNWKSKLPDSGVRRKYWIFKESGNGIVLINPCPFNVSNDNKLQCGYPRRG